MREGSEPRRCCLAAGAQRAVLPPCRRGMVRNGLSGTAPAAERAPDPAGQVFWALGLRKLLFRL